jgi:Bcr/CflA subfamily drug resistance transporter
MTWPRKSDPRKEKIYFALLVNFIVLLAGISTDIYLPSLPALSQHFATTKTLAQMTVTSYAAAIALAQFLAGPISDAYGRKTMLTLSMGMQVLAVLAIIFSPLIGWMIFFRFIQGLGAGFMMVPARAIINDIFTGHDAKKQFNYITISFAVGPIAAPFIGGYLQNYFGWQANFILLLVYILILLLIMLRVYRETCLVMRAFSVNHLWKNYQIILSNRYFLLGAFFVGTVFGYSALFNVAGPFFIQTILHYSAITFGRIALLIGIAWFLGNISSRFLFQVNKKIKVSIALWLSFMSAATMLLFSELHYLNLLTLVIPTFLIIACSGFVFPIYIGECLTLFPKLAASANACLFSLIWVVFSMLSALGALLNLHSLAPLAIAYCSLNLISLFLYYKVLRKF